MKRSKLEKIVKDLGFKFEVGNSFHTIMHIWLPKNRDGVEYNRKFYYPEILGKNEVDELNNKFKKLLVILKDNNIKIRTYTIIDNGILYELILDIKEKTLSFDEQDMDFEIETNIPDKPYNHLNYSSIMPVSTGYGSKGNNNFNLTTYTFNIDAWTTTLNLKSHEKELIYKNLDEIFSVFTIEENLVWLENFAILHKDLKPLQIAIENEIITPKQFTEYVFSQDEIYYSYEKEYTILFKYLSSFKIDKLNTNPSKSAKKGGSRGYLPHICFTPKKIYKDILKNWEFNYESSQKILEFLLLHERPDEFKEFVMVKDAKKYYFDDWDTLQENILKKLRYDVPFIQKLFDEGWMEMEHIDDDYIIEFIENQLLFMDIITCEPLIIKEFIKYKTITNINKLLGTVLTIANENLFHIPEIVKPFIDNFSVEYLDYKQADAEIMKYLKDQDPLKIFLLSQKDFLDYLLEINKPEYLPVIVKDIFLF